MNKPYVAHRPFRGMTLSGLMQLPRGAACQGRQGVISYQGQPICLAGSENARQYFARDDDGQGLLRGRLTQAIQERLSRQDGEYEQRWGRIWACPALLRYKRPEHRERWLWNQEFYDGEIDQLRYIARLAGVRKKGCGI